MSTLACRLFLLLNAEKMYGSIENEAMSLRYISAESKIVRVFLQSRLCEMFGVNCLVNCYDLAICTGFFALL